MFTIGGDHDHSTHYLGGRDRADHQVAAVRLVRRALSDKDIDGIFGPVTVESTWPATATGLIAFDT